MTQTFKRKFVRDPGIKVALLKENPLSTSKTTLTITALSQT
jgi:hypothetical protein